MYRSCHNPGSSPPQCRTQTLLHGFHFSLEKKPRREEQTRLPQLAKFNIQDVADINWISNNEFVCSQWREEIAKGIAPLCHYLTCNVSFTRPLHNKASVTGCSRQKSKAQGRDKGCHINCFDLRENYSLGRLSFHCAVFGVSWNTALWIARHCLLEWDICSVKMDCREQSASFHVSTRGQDSIDKQEVSIFHQHYVDLTSPMRSHHKFPLVFCLS